MIIQIVRTSVTTNTLTFNVSLDGINYGYLLGAKVESDGSITTGVTDTATSSAIYEFDITGYKYIKIPLTNLTGEGATVTVSAVVI